MSNNEKKTNTSKTPKSYKYYYTKASIIRSAVCAILCAALFLCFFICFLVYGGSDRNPTASYKLVQSEKKNPLSVIDGIAADGKGRIYTFFQRTFEINVYDEEGKFLESYQIPCGEPLEGVSYPYEGGIVCEDGKLYAFNDEGQIFVFSEGKGVSTVTKGDEESNVEKLVEKYSSSKNESVLSTGEKIKNNYVFVTREKGGVIINNFPVGLLFSPFSMVMAIALCVLTYFAVRRYNKKVRNQKIKTFFKKNITIKESGGTKK